MNEFVVFEEDLPDLTRGTYRTVQRARAQAKSLSILEGHTFVVMGPVGVVYGRYMGGDYIRSIPGETYAFD